MFKENYKIYKDIFGPIYIIENLTEYANQKEIEFQKNVQFGEHSEYRNIETWKKIYSDGRFKMADFIISHFNIQGTILEIGTGSGWYSSYISRYKNIKKIYALDFSMPALTISFPQVAKWLNADPNKIIRILGDYHNLPFEDNIFDFVICDAALHHSNYPNIIFKEVKRVLKLNGKFIASSEPITSKWREKSQKKKFGMYERSFGVNENIFTKKEWQDFYKKADWNVKFIPYIFTEHASKFTNFIKKYTPLRFLNGYLFSNYIFYSQK